MSDLTHFREKVREYRLLVSRNQTDLAHYLNLDYSEVSNRLNANKKAKLTHENVRAIVRALAQWGAITTQAQAIELLNLMDCPHFDLVDWAAPPLNKLSASLSSVSQSEALLPAVLEKTAGVITPDRAYLSSNGLAPLLLTATPEKGSENSAAIVSADTLTFFFTDIEGSTSLWENLPQAMKKALARHDELLRQTIEAGGGRIFKTVGDSFYATFGAATQALETALAAQRLLQNEKWDPKIGALRVRMALHSGMAEERDNDYFGLAVNRTARLLSAGHGGQILLSWVCAELVREHLPEGMVLKDLGQYQLKDLSRPERIFQLISPDLPAEFPPLRTLETFPTNLPLQLTSFIGREKESKVVRELLASNRLVTLTGAGGVGKTRLALQLASSVRESFRDGVWLVELASLSDPEGIAQAVASVLGVKEASGKGENLILAGLLNYLQGKQLLLLLDNCEHLALGCAQLVEKLLASCWSLKVLATSREGLNIRAEKIFLVSGLSLPQPQTTASFSLQNLQSSEAVELLVERVKAVRPDFTLNGYNAGVVAQLCQQLDGLPLALELAAARVKVLSIEQMALRLKEQFRLLVGGSRTALPRQQTLRATLDWSYELLSPQEQKLFGRLAIFKGSWSLEAAEQICSGEGIEEWEVLDLLGQLVNKSLVAIEQQDSNCRYRLLETLRQYGQEKLELTGEAEKTQAKYLKYYLKLVEELEHTGQTQVTILTQLDREYNNLKAALEQMLRVGAKADALRLNAVLGNYWLTRGYYSEGRSYLTQILALTGESDLAKRAKVLDWIGGLAFNQGDYTAAQQFHEESLVLTQELDDKRGIARSFNGLGNVASKLGEYIASTHFYKESLRIWQELGDKRSVAHSFNCLGGVAFKQGECDIACHYYEESLKIQREIDNKWGIALSLYSLGRAAYDRREYTAARELIKESLLLRREIGDKSNIAYSLDVLGNIAYDQLEYVTASSFFEESLEIRSETDDKTGKAYSFGNLGNLTQRQGDYEAAYYFLKESLVILSETGDKYSILHALTRLLGLVSCPVKTMEDKANSEIYLKKMIQLGGAVSGWLNKLGVELRQPEKGIYEMALEEARMGLDEEAFQVFFNEGKSITLEQAIDYGLTLEKKEAELARD